MSFQGRKPRVEPKDLHVEDVSMRSSLDLSGKAASENQERDLDLQSEGESTFRDFVPREVANLERKIKMRDTEKQERIGFKSGDLSFDDPEIK